MSILFVLLLVDVNTNSLLLQELMDPGQISVTIPAIWMYGISQVSFYLFPRRLTSREENICIAWCTVF